VADQAAFLARESRIEGFAIVGVTIVTAPHGVDERLLHALWDIGTKWGQCTYAGMGFLSCKGGLLLELYLKAAQGGSDGFSVTMSILGGPTFIRRPIFLQLRNGMEVLWDGELSATEAFVVIQEIDEHASNQGRCINGHRLPIDDPTSSPSRAGRMNAEWW
jgi:hypothetical protein